MTETTEPRVVLDDAMLYFGDNGRCFCGLHAGVSARYTGRDISGQRVAKITPKMAAAFAREVGFPPACETCDVIGRNAEVQR